MATEELVAEELALRKELSKSREELVGKQHTLEILRKEKGALEAKRPEALREQVQEADDEIAELRSQLKALTGFSPAKPKQPAATASRGSPSSSALAAGRSAGGASGWGALINDAKSKTLDTTPTVIMTRFPPARPRLTVLLRFPFLATFNLTVLKLCLQAPLRRQNFRSKEQLASSQHKPLALVDQMPPLQQPLAFGSSFSLGGGAPDAATSYLALGN